MGEKQLYPNCLQGGTFPCIQVQNMPGDPFCATCGSGQVLHQHHWLPNVWARGIQGQMPFPKTATCQHERGYAQNQQFMALTK